MTERCDARIRPLATDVEIRCERDDEHSTHRGTVRDHTRPGSATVIDWQDDDRRTFRGVWPGHCATVWCVLPAGHPRYCAP
jgi:hypothetical protein